MEKKKITIEVEPATAVATVGLLRGIFPSIIEQLERQAATNGSPLKFNKVNAARKSKVDDNTAKMQSIKQLGV